MALTRDTLGFAVKATNIVKDGVSIPLFKDPKTDNGTKKSAKGYLRVVKTMNDYSLEDNVTFSEEQSFSNELKPLFVDGKFYNLVTFDEIRNKLKGTL